MSTPAATPQAAEAARLGYSADGSSGSGIGGISPSKMRPLYSALDVGSSGAMVTMTADRPAWAPCDWDVDIPMQVVPGGVLQVLKAIKAGSGGCWVGLHRTEDPIGLDAHAALREFTRGIMLVFRLDPRYEVSGETIDVMLPAGPALRVDMVEPFPEGDLHQVSYSLAAPDGYIFLNCIGYSRPDDDWLSIAETFEFLPEGE